MNVLLFITILGWVGFVFSGVLFVSAIYCWCCDNWTETGRNYARVKEVLTGQVITSYGVVKFGLLLSIFTALLVSLN